VVIENNKVKQIDIIRGAPCGATWDAASKVIGMNVTEASVRIGLETQFFCTANPANWDFVYQKSPVHFAADVHRKAFDKGII